MVTLPDDITFIRSLSQRSGVLASAARALDAGDLTSAKALVVEHFRSRTTPRFFLDARQIRELVRDIGAAHPEWRARLIASAEREASFRFRIYGMEAKIETEDDWRNIPHGPGRDVLYAERPSRFGFAPRLALASLHGAKTREALGTLVRRWSAASHGVGNSIAYYSSHVTVYRIIALAWCIAILRAGSSDDPALEFLMFKIVVTDGRFVAQSLPHTAPNNHLLASGFGLWFLGLLYPEFPDAEMWLKRGEAIWLEELSRQVYPDGGSVEHSIHYQEHICEMMCGYLLLSQRNNLSVPRWVSDLGERMLCLQSSLSGPEGVPLPLGDTTEDPLFPLDTLDDWGCAAWREIYRTLYTTRHLPPTADHPGRERAMWLLGKRSATTCESSVEPTFDAFPDAGHFVMSDHHGRSRLVFRTGPSPGRLALPGHMHADLLSVYLSLEGESVIVPTGTYTYRANPDQWKAGTPAWRRHLLSPWASNGLVIGEHDPLARGSGDFPGHIRGSIRSRVRLSRVSSGARLSVTEGENLGDSVYAGHFRGVVHVWGGYWLVYDRLPRDLDVDAYLHYHVLAETRVKACGPNQLTVATTRNELNLLNTASLSAPVLLNGAPSPLAGWHSPRYGELRTATLIRFPVAEFGAVHATLLQPMLHGSVAAEISATTLPGGGIGFRVEAKEWTDYLILGSGDLADRRCEGFGIEFIGAALWARCRGTTVTALRCLRARSVYSDALSLSLTWDDGPGDMVSCREPAENAM
jgi:hypothetical protein